jgi:hypothetical protein
MGVRADPALMPHSRLLPATAAIAKPPGWESSNLFLGPCATGDAVIQLEMPAAG